MHVTVKYTPQYDDFDDNFKPTGNPTDHLWVVDIVKSKDRGRFTKLATKPTKRQLRKIIKGYLHASQ